MKNNKYNKNNLNTKTIASCAWMCNSGDVTVLWVVLMIGVPRRSLGPRDNRAGAATEWRHRGPGWRAALAVLGGGDI